MKDRFDFYDLKDMAETFATDNESMALRIEVIKEICELPEVNIKWSKLPKQILYYYAQCPEHIGCHPWWFKRAICNDARGYGIIINGIDEY